MNHRHDEPPALSPAQQTEVLRLAARLQEEASITRDLFAAAEEAGIERRYLDEAVTKVTNGASSPLASLRPKPVAALSAIGALVLVAALATLFANSPEFGVATLLSFLLAAFPTTRGRSRGSVLTLLLLAWILIDALLVASGLNSNPENWSVLIVEHGLAWIALQIVAAVVGTEVARWAVSASKAKPSRRVSTP